MLIEIDIDIILEVGDFFKGDTHKTYLWLTTENLNIGGYRPTDMMKLGRSEKLLKWIKGQKEGNLP